MLKHVEFPCESWDSKTTGFFKTGAGRFGRFTRYFVGMIREESSAFFYRRTPSGYVQIAIENGPVEIVDSPIDSMMMFQFVLSTFTRG